MALSRRRLFLLGGGGLLLGGVLFGKRRFTGYKIPPNYVGRDLPGGSEANSDGWVTVEPATLASRAGLALDTYTLARCIASEHATGNSVEKAGIAWVVRTVAKRKGVAITKLLTNTTRYGNKGLYGSQEHGRFASTARNPTDRDVYVAKQVLSGAWPDPTGGADQFFAPQTQDALHARKPELYVSSAEIIARWTSGTPRKVVVVPPGVRSADLVFFRPIG